MGTQTTNGSRFRFGAFELDLRTGELRKNGTITNLPLQPCKILTLLASHPGELITREQIQEKIWGDDTFVDFENGLNSAINRIRSVLGDDADSPRYIETLPRRGYRFIATLEKVNGTSPAENAVIPTGVASEPSVYSGNGDSLPIATSPPALVMPRVDTAVAATPVTGIEIAAPAKEKSRALWGWAIAAGVFLIALGAVAFLLRPQLPPPKILGYRQLTHDGRGKQFGPLVTDGARVYFSEALGPGLTLVYVSTAGGETVTVPTVLHTPVIEDISPDGTELLVSEGWSSGAENPLFYVVTALNGSVHALGGVAGQCGGWLADGRIIFEKGNDIYMVNRDGSEPRKVVTRPLGTARPRSSPDGKLIRFESGGGFWEVGADGTNLHPLLPGWNNPESDIFGSWTPDAKYFVFDSTRKELTSIWAVYEGKDVFHKVNREPIQLTGGPMNVSFPVPSRDGKKLFAVGALPPGAELRRYDARTHNLAPYLGGIPAWWLDFSRHGNWVTFVSVPEGTLWRSKPDGSERLRLTYPPMEVAAPRWSPDSKQIAFTARTSDKGDWNLYLISADGGTPELLLPADRDNSYPDWSPDGKRIVFGNNSTTFGLHSSLRILDLQNRQLSVVPGSEGFVGPRWSPDGRHLVAWNLNHDASEIYDFNTKTWSELVKQGAWDQRWSPDGKFVYLFGPDYGEPSIYRVRLSDRKAERVMSLSGVVLFSQEIFGPSLSLAPDNSFIMSLEVGTQEVYALDWEAP